MSAADVRALREAFADGSLLAPDPSVPNLVALSRAITGLAGDADRPPDPCADALAEQIGEHDHIVLFAADGFGRCFVDKMGDDTVCKRHMQGVVRAAFPSSTGRSASSGLRHSTRSTAGNPGGGAMTPATSLSKRSAPTPASSPNDGVSIAS